jgi:hypothetical protein
VSRAIEDRHFNINNINKRLHNLMAWLAKAQPDVVCLQELKVEQRAFPAGALRDLGYRGVWLGERSWNGVAILARECDPVLTRSSRKRIQRLMRILGIEALYPKPNLSRPAPGQQIYPYLLRGVEILRPNHVWSTDITYLPMRGGFLYLVRLTSPPTLVSPPTTCRHPRV